MVSVFVIGIIVALLVEEITGVTPGGIVVAAFLALAWNEPLRIAATLGVAFAAMGIVALAQRRFLLYGRRRFAYAVLAGVVLKQLLVLLFPALNVLSYGLLVVGFIVPGLLAETSLRQGVGRTLAATAVAVVLTRLIAVAVLGWTP